MQLGQAAFPKVLTFAAGHASDRDIESVISAPGEAGAVQPVKDRWG
jgi:hypothetical protein